MKIADYIDGYDRYRQWIEEGLDRYHPRRTRYLLHCTNPCGIAPAGRETFTGVCCLLAAELFNSDRWCAPHGLRLEMVHAYSLIHDDLPCMDDDDLRRENPPITRFLAKLSR